MSLQQHPTSYLSKLDTILRRKALLRGVGLIVTVCAVFVAQTAVAYAGFGITPPYVNNDRLTRGTVYQQVINLVRSDPTEDLQTTITINVPGADDWISIDKGQKFILPKGATDVPITITVRVPKDAQYKDYKGAIRIRTESTQAPEEGGVSIALGAQIDVTMKVVDKIFDFNVRRVRMVDLEEGRTKWGLFFPGKIRFYMTIENTGNTDYGPTKVHFDIYDSEVETLLESTDNTNDIELIAPFAIKEIVAELPTRLPAGRYTAKYTIFKGEGIAQQGQVNVSIATAGAIFGYEGYGFWGLSTQDKVKAVGMFGTPLALLLLLIVVLFVNRRKRNTARSNNSPR